MASLQGGELPNPKVNKQEKDFSAECLLLSLSCFHF